MCVPWMVNIGQKVGRSNGWNARAEGFRYPWCAEVVSRSISKSIEDKAGILGQYKGGDERKRKNLIRLGVDQDHAYA